MTMDETVAAVMRHCRNFFEYHHKDDTFTIENGVITPAVDGDWLYISGSRRNDGVVHMTRIDTGLQDETFTGRIYSLAPPREFLALCASVSAYTEKINELTPVSESFGPYSVNHGSGSNGSPKTWNEAFSANFVPYRRMFTEVG